MTQTIRSLKMGKDCYKVSAGFTLHREGADRWKVSGRDLSGRYRRIRFSAASQAEAINAAREILKQPANKAAEDFPVVAIADALYRSAQARPWKTSYTRRTETYICGYFLDWVDSRGLSYWHELRFEHIEAYQSALILRGLSSCSVRHYLKPVRRAAKWMAANWPGFYHDICAGVRQPTLVRRDNVALTIHEVLDLLDWLAQEKPCQCRKRCECVKTQQFYERVLAGIALQGLMGLQLQEAYRLTWEKIDFRKETICIDGLVKNRYRVRVIPVPKVVVWLLRRMKRVVPSTAEELFAYTDYTHYSKAVKKSLCAYADRCLERVDCARAEKFRCLPPKDLRNTIQTAANEGGWFSYYLQRYVGQAPTTTSQKFYCADRVQDLLPNFRKHVLCHLEAEIEAWPAAPASAILPGPRLRETSKR